MTTRDPRAIVLVTAVGSATARGVVKGLRRGRIPVRIIGTDTHSASDVLASRECDGFYTVPTADSPAYLGDLREIIEREGVSIVVPIVDLEVEVLASAAEDLGRAGVQVWCGPEAAVRTCNDKRLFAEFCVATDLPAPRSWLPDAALAADDLPSSVVVKPARGLSSRGVQIVSAEELPAVLARSPQSLVQEWLPAPEHTVDLVALGHDELRVVAACVRERLDVRAGIATRARTVDRPDLVEIAVRVVLELGLAGPSNVQFRGPATSPRLLEVNPRFAAGLPLAIAAGVDAPRLLLEFSLGDAPPREILCAEPGVVMFRYYEEAFERVH